MASPGQLFFAAFLAFICVCKAGQRPIFDPIYGKLTNARCECFDATFCKIERCDLKAVNRIRAEFFSNITIWKRPIRNVLLNMEFFRKYSSYQPFPIKINLDFCKFMENPAKNPLFNNMFKWMKPKTNVNHSCPFNEEHLLVQNFAFDRNEYFNFIPEGNYKVILKYTIDKKEQIQMTYWVEIRNPENTFLS